ncbi:wee1-like protein kinase [Tripterygium wilfordii]|uniref:Wee1-like protein kinase n=1 Tax=Tripterygium wilfordii TaxID=458696 RepID=A0A7J7CBB2_TRIWF|nr:wee1-like protein kinase [Tripterygium wilfordii]
MRRRAVKKGRISKSRGSSDMEGSLTRHLQVQLRQVSLLPPQQRQSLSTNTSDSSIQHLPVASAVGDAGAAADLDEKDFILSQDFFCTPDYITPDNQNLPKSVDCNKEEIPCPRSPEKINTVKTKRQRQDFSSINPVSPSFSDHQQVIELAKDILGTDELMKEKLKVNGTPKIQNYISPSVVALRCRVMPPPCIKNPYLDDGMELDVDPFGNQRSKCAGILSAFVGGDGLSRYHSDFHEIKQIGNGNFSRVFKVLKRIDGCFYAVKHSTRHLHQDTERYSCLLLNAHTYRSHENIVGYYSSWFENEQLYIQMELCDHSLSASVASQSFTEGEVLKILYQMAKALQFMHGQGIAHLDVKPDNIYVKNGVYKLGDFGCATLLDKSLPIEEGDARYMPQEILNENYDHLDKVDIFSLGTAVYELIRGSPLLESGHHSFIHREGKLPLLPGHTLQFQNLLKVMMDPDPTQRPSAKELMVNPIFERIRRNAKT